MIRAAEYKTIEEYQAANKKAHDILSKIEGYNSKSYAPKHGIETIHNTYLLPLVDKYEKYLLDNNMKFSESEYSILIQKEL